MWRPSGRVFIMWPPSGREIIIWPSSGRVFIYCMGSGSWPIQRVSDQIFLLNPDPRSRLRAFYGLKLNKKLEFNEKSRLFCDKKIIFVCLPRPPCRCSKLIEKPPALLRNTDIKMWNFFNLLFVIIWIRHYLYGSRIRIWILPSLSKKVR